MPPETRYARNGEVHIAYQVVGDGPVDLLYVPTWISQVEHYWELPRVAQFFERLASFSRLILFDRRGSGLSDPLQGDEALEDQVDDVQAVLDAAGSERAAVFAQLEGGAMAMLFAATYPERVSSLVLYSCFARATRDDGYEWAPTEAERDARQEALMANWGTGQRLGTFAPSAADDPQLKAWLARLERLAWPPGLAARYSKLIGRTDVRRILPSIRVPTLVTYRRDDPLIDPEHSHYLVEHIPGATLAVLEGRDNLIIASDATDLLEQVERHVTGTVGLHEPDRVLATVLFTDIVGSTQRAAAIGDADWRRELAAHDALVRAALARHNGREVKSVGDGFLATFDGPARAVRCAQAIVEQVGELGLALRAGVHTGEVEVVGDDVAGLAVHIGARVAAAAGPGEVLVSGTVRDLVVGSRLEFEDRGTHALKGVPGEWKLFALRLPGAVLA